MPSNHLILSTIAPFSCPQFSPASFPRVFSSESALCITWPKYWSFNFSISPSNEYSGLISFRIDCFDLLAVQETLKSLLQHQSSKASIFQCSTFFRVQLSHPYMTTGKTIFLVIFVGLVFCLDPLWSQSGLFPCWYFVKLFMFNLCLYHCPLKSARPVPRFQFLSKFPIFKG